VYVLALGLGAGIAAASAAGAQDPSPGLDLPLYTAPEPAIAAPFAIPAGDLARTRAIHCLTQAIYYEAATEPREGQEAVAQVVLNRLKHPAFPKSVCGVVFEGSQRATGCQFTFTCDGSLARAPVSWRWDAAEQVAADALDGRVADRVGASTHYHAAWMTPYWSASLVETRRIGGHVFYRMPGALGSAEALTGQYSGQEPAAPAGLAATAEPASKVDRKGRRSRHARAVPPPVPGVSQFSVWGLQVATVSERHGVVVVQDGS